MIQYSAVIRYDRKDKAFTVEFPDLPGCVTHGKNLEKAKSNAKEALSGYLATVDSRKMKFPTPSKIKGKDIYYIKPDKNVAFAVWLKTKR